MILAFQSLLPGDCLLTGLCGVTEAAPVVPSGIMFLALGLVLLGAWGIAAGRKRKPH